MYMYISYVYLCVCVCVCVCVFVCVCVCVCACVCVGTDKSCAHRKAMRETEVLTLLLEWVLLLECVLLRSPQGNARNGGTH